MFSYYSTYTFKNNELPYDVILWARLNLPRLLITSNHSIFSYPFVNLKWHGAVREIRTLSSSKT